MLIIIYICKKLIHTKEYCGKLVNEEFGVLGVIFLLSKFNEVLKGTYQELNGIKYTHVEKGQARGSMEVKPFHLNPNGTIHGAALVALADSVAMAGLIYTYDMVPAATTNLSISFLRAVKSGEVRAEAKILSQGRTVSAWQTDCYDEDNNLLATLQIQFALIKKSSAEWEKKFVEENSRKS